MSSHHQVLVLQARLPCFWLSILMIQSALIVTLPGLMAQETQIAADALSRQSWLLEDDSWNQWWSYSGVSGPSYWGLLNSDWFMCDKGRRQSPIDLNTKALVYDPYLTPLGADNNLISGVLYNDGHSIVFNNSLAALTRIALMEDQKTKQQQQQQRTGTTNEESRTELALDSGNATSTSTKTSHLLARRDSSSVNSNEIFTPDEHLARFELIESDTGFMIEAGAGEDSSVEGRHDQPSTPMLMKELSNNVDLTSTGESHRLQSEQIGGELQRQQQPQQSQSDVDSFDETDQLAGNSANSAGSALNLNQVHFTGAGAAYSYRFEALQLKFGQGSVQSSSSKQADGSEHQIDGRSFAAELQMFAYNWQLYRSYDESLTRPYGLLAISILIDTISPPDDNDQTSSLSRGERANGDKSSSNDNNNKTARAPMTSNEQLERLLVSATNALGHRGAFVLIRDLNLSALLPETEQFVTYEGSLTHPGCHESVTWLILNRPLYISKQILDKLRSISADELSTPNLTGTIIAGNTRPTQPVNNRPIRTNIRPRQSRSSSMTTMNKPLQEVCPRLWTRYEYAKQTSAPPIYRST